MSHAQSSLQVINGDPDFLRHLRESALTESFLCLTILLGLLHRGAQLLHSSIFVGGHLTLGDLPSSGVYSHNPVH